MGEWKSCRLARDVAGDGARAELATGSAKRSKNTLDIRVSSVVVVVPHTHTHSDSRLALASVRWFIFPLCSRFLDAAFVNSPGRRRTGDNGQQRTDSKQDEWRVWRPDGSATKPKQTNFFVAAKIQDECIGCMWVVGEEFAMGSTPIQYCWEGFTSLQNNKTN